METNEKNTILYDGTFLTLSTSFTILISIKDKTSNIYTFQAILGVSNNQLLFKGG